MSYSPDPPRVGEYGHNSWQTFVSTGVWFGIVLGYLEAVLLSLYQWLGPTQYVSAPVFWINPTVYALCLGLLGCLAWVFTRRIHINSSLSFALFLFLALVLVDVFEIVLPDSIARYAKLALALGAAIFLVRLINLNRSWWLTVWQRSTPWMLLSIPVCFLVVWGGQHLVYRHQLINLPATDEDTPNVLLYVIDTLRADHLGSYGYDRDTSPTLDRMAQSGVRFENAISTASWTLPAHHSMFTGLTAQEHGIGRSHEGLPADTPTLAGRLRDKGFRTAAFSANVFFVTHDRLGNGFMLFDDYYQDLEDMLLRTMYGRAVEAFILQPLGYEDIPSRKRAENVHRSFLNWVDTDPQQPFFGFINILDTHDPYLPPQPFRQKYSNSPDPGGILNWRVGRADPELTEDEIQEEIAAYDGAIAYVDEMFRHLLEQLEQRGILQNTIVVVTSDHGESFNEHGFFLHGHSLYRQQIQVPLMMYWPGAITAGMVVDTPVSIASIPATIMDLLGYPETDFKQPSLTDTWESTQATWPYPLSLSKMKDWGPAGSPALITDQQSLITPDWHIIQSATGQVELFNWENDPVEQTNMADEQTNLIQALTSRIE